MKANSYGRRAVDVDGCSKDVPRFWAASIGFYPASQAEHPAQ